MDASLSAALTTLTTLPIAELWATPLLYLLPAALLFFFGACIGSFLNVVIYRSTTGESWVSGRSHCEKCKKPIAWYDNIPLLSFFVLRAQCRHCGAKLSYSHPIVEGLTGIIFVWWWIVGSLFFQLTQMPFTFLQPLFWLLVALLLLVIAIVDLKELVIPTTPLILLTALVIVYRIALVASGIMRFQDLLYSVLAMATVTLLFWSLWYFTKGRGLGFGDVQLVVPLSLLVGWPEVFVWLFVSFLSGAVIGLLLIAFKRAQFGKPVPFGPFLILGTAAALIWGNQLVSWYVTLIS